MIPGMRYAGGRCRMVCRMGSAGFVRTFGFVVCVGAFSFASLLSCATKAAVPVPAPVPVLAAPVPEPVIIPEPPAPDPDPIAALTGARVTALSLYDLRAGCVVEAFNPGTRDLVLESVLPVFSVEGNEMALDALIPDLSPQERVLAPGASLAIPLELDFNLQDLEGAGLVIGERTDLGWIFRADLVFLAGDGSKREVSAQMDDRFPVIREPKVSIKSIKILRSVLINTTLKLTLTLENPNGFPVEFRSLAYKLYGEGRPWADGRAEAALLVPGQTELDTELLIIMNFIDMKRDLLDMVNQLRTVNYRLKGETLIGTGMEFLPEFRMGFDERGSTEVLR